MKFKKILISSLVNLIFFYPFAVWLKWEVSGTQQGWHLFLGEWEKIKSRNSWWGRTDGCAKKVGGRETWTSAKAVPVTLLATLQFLLNVLFNRCHRYHWETQHAPVLSLLAIVMKTKSSYFCCCFCCYFCLFGLVYFILFVWDWLLFL